MLLFLQVILESLLPTIGKWFYYGIKQCLRITIVQCLQSCRNLTPMLLIESYAIFAFYVLIHYDVFFSPIFLIGFIFNIFYSTRKEIFHCCFYNHNIKYNINISLLSPWKNICIMFQARLNILTFDVVIYILRANLGDKLEQESLSSFYQ